MIKRIESKEQKEKKSKRNQWILAGILVLIMLASIFGIIFQDLAGTGTSSQQSSDVTFNGYTFQAVNGYYVLQIGSQTFYFSQNPQNVDSIIKTVNLSKTMPDYIGQVVYVSSEDYNSYNEIYSDMGNYTTRIQEACAENETCADSTLPTKTCADNLIIVKEAPEDKIYQKDNCVYIEGNQNDLLSLTDEFLMRIIGVK